MSHVLIAIHLMVVLAMIGVVLLQRSEGGALGIGGGGGGGGGFMSARGAGNVLTRATAILAAVFFATSIGLTLLARYQAGPSDILDRIETQGPAVPVGGADDAGGEQPTTEGVLDAFRPAGGTTDSAGPQVAPEQGAPAGAAPQEAPAAPAGASPQSAAPAAPGEAAGDGTAAPSGAATPALDAGASSEPADPAAAPAAPAADAGAAPAEPAPAAPAPQAPPLPAGAQ